MIKGMIVGGLLVASIVTITDSIPTVQPPSVGAISNEHAQSAPPIIVYDAPAPPPMPFEMNAPTPSKKSKKGSSNSGTTVTDSTTQSTSAKGAQSVTTKHTVKTTN